MIPVLFASDIIFIECVISSAYKNWFMLSCEKCLMIDKCLLKPSIYIAASYAMPTCIAPDSIPFYK